MAKYTIREASIGDADAIADLRCRIKEYEAFETHTYGLFWKNIIWNNPCGLHKSIVAVNKEDKIIGHYALIPYKFSIDGKPFTGGFVCQLMVDENYRNELVFPRMMQKMLREFKDSGIDFLYSLSSRNEVVKAHQAFGFRHVGNIPVYARPYKLTRIVPRLLKSKALNVALLPFLSVADRFQQISLSSIKKSMVTKEISRFSPSVDGFLEKVQGYFPCSIIRKAETLNWRTVDAAVRNYTVITSESEGMITGYVIMRLMKIKDLNILAIVDVMFNPEDTVTGSALLNAVHKCAIKVNADLTSFLMNNHDPFFPMLKKGGYYRTPQSIALFVYQPRSSHLPLYDPDKWHLTWIDHDSI
jgi:N-acetylglutamate synthase-like GNAT family acetyltransferase